MKIFVKTLGGIHFEIQVTPQDTVADLKNKIETIQGVDTYPALKQMLIHQGKVLKDETTLGGNNVVENSFVVIMLTKSKITPNDGSTTSTASTTKASQTSDVPSILTPTTAPQSPVLALAQPPAVTSLASAAGAPVASLSLSDVYGQAASNLVAGSNLDGTIQQILDMGEGAWDRDTVLRALRAAFNNPERAVEYLYSGVPEQPDIPIVAHPPANEQPAAQPATVPLSGPNANPLDLFPQGLLGVDTNTGVGNLDFLRNSQQFRTLQAMVQANPEILQPMLQELGKQNPNLMSIIQRHQADFLRLINEPAQGVAEGRNTHASAMPQTLTVTSEEREAIGRLEGMGFDRTLVLEVFFACNKNEELAANYLLDHIHEFEE